MAHEIEQYSDGTYSFVENTNQKEGMAWHKLGIHFDRPLTVAEAIEGCRANYEVESRKVYQMDENGNPYEIENAQAIVRKDNNVTLGLAKGRYTIVQNAQAFDFVDFLTSGSIGEKATIDAAGVLGKGERVFVTAKFDETLKIKGDTQMDMYVVFANSFDGSSPVTVMITPVRVVCNNTLNFAMSHNTGRMSIRHTASAQSRIAVNEESMKNACNVLKLMEHYKTNLVAQIDRLGNVSLTDEHVEHLIKDLFCPEAQRKELKAHNYNITGKEFSTRYRNIVENVTNSVYGGIGQREGAEQNTGLWFINGLTTHFQNNEKAKGLEGRKLETKFDNIMRGTAYDILNRANDLVLQVA